MEIKCKDRFLDIIGNLVWCFVLIDLVERGKWFFFRL